MDKLNDVLRELGISKVKLSKILGVSRQMIYNYLELDDINKWPKDKKVLLFNLLGIKSSDELNNIKVDTDYILDVETRMANLFDNTEKNDKTIDLVEYDGIGKKQKELLHNIFELLKENLEDDKDSVMFNAYRYLYYYIQSMSSSKELKYILAYMAKASGAIKPDEFAFNEDEQFIFESILFSAMTLYTNGGTSKSRLAESHKRFVNQIEHKMEEKMSRTLELNILKVQALRELGYTEINSENTAEVLEKIAEIESRRVS